LRIDPPERDTNPPPALFLHLIDPIDLPDRPVTGIEGFQQNPRIFLPPTHSAKT